MFKSFLENLKKTGPVVLVVIGAGIKTGMIGGGKNTPSFLLPK